MAGNPLYTVLDHLRRLHRVADAAQRSDRELLRAFATNNDHDAFTLVVTRHAPLVWGVCRRILGHHHDAEDAFQATFLILARRARSMRWQSSVGGWLHTVAQRLAVRALKQAQQRRIQERQASQTSPADTSLRELAAVVDEELRHLPAKYREPLLLHYLEGATAETAARQLGLSRAAFYNRLTRGRELLRERLSRQGLSLAAPLLAAALAAEAEAASRSLIQATIGVVRGSVPERVAALAAETLAGTALMKMKIGLALSLLLGVTAGGLAMLTPGASMSPLPQAERPAETPKAEDKITVRVDRYGDPLPPGAIARLGTLRFRIDCHRVEQLAFAPDGKTLAAASSRGLTLFEVASGKQMKVINPSGIGFSRLVYSPDGKRLMTYGVVPNGAPLRKMVVQIWDVGDGSKTFEKEVPNLCWLGWSSKGEPRVACLGDDEIIYHELSADRKLHFPAKDLLDSRLVSLCRCVAAKTTLAVSGANGSIHAWDLASGKVRFTLQAGVFVTSLALSDDGRWLASIARDAANKNAVQLWNATTGELVRTFSRDSEIPSWREVLFAPDGKTLAVIGLKETRFWDAVGGREISRIRTPSHSFGQASSFSPNSKTFVTTEFQNGAITLWDVEKGTAKSQPEGHCDPLTQAAFSPDGKRVASCAGMDGTIRIWDSATGEPLLRIHRMGWARDCAFSADGRMLYSCWTDDKLYFDDAASGRELDVQRVEDPDHPKFKPSGLRLFLSDDCARLTAFHTGDNNMMEMIVTAWDADTHKLLLRRRRVDEVFFNALAADGRTLAAAHFGPPLGDGTPGRILGNGPMHLEDLATGETRLTFPTLAGQTVPVVFSPDGRLLISFTDGPLKSGQRGATIRLWEVLTATELWTFPTSFARKATFTPDGRLLAIPTAENEILVWDLSLGKEHQRFHSFGAAVGSLVFSPDGCRLASGLSDSTLLVWAIETPSAIAARKFGVQSVAKAWDDLASSDAPRAFRARWLLASAPAETVSILKEHLHPAKPAEPQYLRRLLADLDSEQFAVREKAQKELETLGDLAEPSLRQMLANNPSLEMRQRVQAILERLRGPVTQPELLQALRAVAVLEDIDTSQARGILKELANGAPHSRITREAKASLERVQRRSALNQREK